MADSRSLGAMHLSANSSYEPQRSNNFQVEFYGLPGQGTEQIMLACSDFTLPNITNDPIEIQHGNSSVKFAGRTNFQGVDRLTCIDWITTDIEKIIDQWRALVYNPEDDTIGWASRYKKEGSVTEFGPDGTFERQWKLMGCWPSGVNYGELSHEQNDIKKVELTIAYDKALRL